ncbi:MAG: hypothetical protein IMY71_10400 [Bacteroidetes bacterium]|nr:hypothetical protein [Bacteroidota bacterium]
MMKTKMFGMKDYWKYNPDLFCTLLSSFLRAAKSKTTTAQMKERKQKTSPTAFLTGWIEKYACLKTLTKAH